MTRPENIFVSRHSAVVRVMNASHRDYCAYMALPRGPDRERFIRERSDALPEYLEAATAGDAEACFLLGRAHDVGSAGGNDSPNEAVKWYRKAAELGNVFAQYNLGVIYEGGRGIEKDEVEAARWYRKAADEGLADAQRALGNLYYSGRGLEKDEVEAVKWYRKAAEQGDPSGQ
ncbi:MAG TPA: tetratricopeptide repeat protein, partial [Leptospiraceae bacterium]|nr:tetratricopeptide repeat protein [Leptospiraceae bacterium]